MTHDTELEQALENQRRYCMSEAAQVILALGIDLDPNDHNEILDAILAAREPGSMCNRTESGTGVTSLAYLRGYEDGLVKAAWIVDNYAVEHSLAKLSISETHSSQYIYAALAVVAMRIQECDPPEYADIVSDVTVRNST